MTRGILPWPVVAAIVAIGSVATASAAPSGARLQTLTRQEVSDAQAAGVGCAWSLPEERTMRFAAADDHAAIKINGRVIRLRPVEGAKDMFPFTYNAWTDGDLRLTIARARGGRRRGSVIANEAVLTLVTASGSRAMSGRLECGD